MVSAVVSCGNFTQNRGRESKSALSFPLCVSTSANKLEIKKTDALACSYDKVPLTIKGREKIRVHSRLFHHRRVALQGLNSFMDLFGEIMILMNGGNVC